MAETTAPRTREHGEGWRLRPKSRFLDQLAGFAAGGVLGWWALWALADHHFRTAAVVLVLLGWLIYRRRAGLEAKARAPRLRKGGLVLPSRTPTPAVVPIICVLAVVFTGGTVLVLVQALRHQIDVTLPGMLGAVLCAILSALLSVGGFAGVRDLSANRGLRLTPDALDVRTLRPSVTVLWADLAAVLPHWTRDGDASVRNWLSFETRSGTTTPATDMNLLDSEPDVILGILIYYLEHPEDRAELGTEASMQRVASISRSEG